MGAGAGPGPGPAAMIFRPPLVVPAPVSERAVRRPSILLAEVVLAAPESHAFPLTHAPVIFRLVPLKFPVIRVVPSIVAGPDDHALPPILELPVSDSPPAVTFPPTATSPDSVAVPLAQTSPVTEQEALIATAPPATTRL
jgi:hypothetical protein